MIAKEHVEIKGVVTCIQNAVVAIQIGIEILVKLGDLVSSLEKLEGSGIDARLMVSRKQRCDFNQREIARKYR